MARTEFRIDSLDTHMINMSFMMKSMATQIRKLANALQDRNRGQFPSNTEVNPIEHCKSIVLRSGKEVGVNESKAEVEKEKKVEEAEIGDSVNSESKPRKSKDGSEHKSALKPKLYLQRFKKKTLDEQLDKFLEIFKKIHINIPFADVLEQITNYSKFLKEVMSKKRKLEINLMSLSVFKILELGKVKPTTITLQLADRLLTYLRGIIEDVLVKIDKFIFPTDFVVLDIEEDKNMSLILGRPFLSIVEATIDVKKGELTMGIVVTRTLF
ncbi:uncharacterized protein [Henckelia pumila]|uniref:uncharacterized protein n=1 Tax=Henckelia pumila TaxID=405737 RepID=UPI003C6DBA8F